MTLIPVPEPTFLDSVNGEMLVALIILLGLVGRDATLLMIGVRAFDRASVIRLVATLSLAALVLFSGP